METSSGLVSLGSNLSPAVTSEYRSLQEKRGETLSFLSCYVHRLYRVMLQCLVHRQWRDREQHQ